MARVPNINAEDEIDIRKVYDLVRKNYRSFIICMISTMAIATFLNLYLVPKYKISASILVNERNKQFARQEPNNYLNSNLVLTNQNFQNELWILKSSTVLERAISNLGLQVSYYRKDGFRYIETYKDSPFRVRILRSHPQPVGVRFYISIQDPETFFITAESGKIFLYDFLSNQVLEEKKNWSFRKYARFGELIETADMAFVVEPDTLGRPFPQEPDWYGFNFSDISVLESAIKKKLKLNGIDIQSTVVEILFKSNSVNKGIDLVNEVMNVYSSQNLDRKNHIASITIDYIEAQLNEISDSLSQTEDNLQRFRSSRELLDLTDQASGMSTQYMNLQNQLAELVTRKRYYDYVSDYVSKNENFSNMIIPASLGIQDQLLNNLLSELISDQSQHSNLIENNQRKNPLVQKLEIRIENLKKTISDNIDEVSRSTNIEIDEVNKRIAQAKSEISKLPETQRQLGNIERQYRLNDAIYNYLMEKRAEAKITKASNLPDNLIIEPAKKVGIKPVSPNKTLNYLIAFLMGLLLPFGYVLVKSTFIGKIESQDDIIRLTLLPVLGKIRHSNFKTTNLMHEYPGSSVAESFRVLRTNIELYFREEQRKVILVTSSLGGEGKTFVSKNLALSYAQLEHNTLFIDFDLRKPQNIFSDDDMSREGLSSYLTGSAGAGNIIVKSPHSRLDYIVAGGLPSNPVELIARERTGELFASLKNRYDKIILDTTPLGYVADAFLLFEYSDVNIILTRQDYTDKNVFMTILEDLKVKNIRNGCIVINDNRFDRDQYGYGSGYYSRGKMKKVMEKAGKRASHRLPQLRNDANYYRPHS